MSKLFLFILVVTLASGSIAAVRPNTTAMTCDQAAATVARAGGIVLSTGTYTYERFVSSTQFCERHEITEPGLAPTRDSRQCQVGFVCVRPDWLDRH